MTAKTSWCSGGGMMGGEERQRVGSGVGARKNSIAWQSGQAPSAAMEDVPLFPVPDPGTLAESTLEFEDGLCEFRVFASQALELAYDEDSEAS